MPEVRALRELETWSAGNIIGGLLLLALVTLAIVVAVRRYLDE
jgi:formate/nitrite transporter FocA (FNT family)